MSEVTLPHADEATLRKSTSVRLRLYIARTTPNSVRAEQNLMAALSALDDAGIGLGLEIVDVFTNPRRALRDGVIVTPMLIGMTAIGRLTMIGELTDAAKLALFLRTLWDEQAIKAIKTPAVE